ncbi:hypothetical protein AMTR_s00057p00086230 [Amborella trichopoda]|uniref:Uncharacterized protein n=1 Tax=Amborella trichopoda TaxID=13333 RepID=U5D8S7_AMBTC|nr:hypothetical protein AMTR_s00057p00086230 [Amborella trichopoda]
MESQRSDTEYVLSGSRCALRHYVIAFRQCNTLESQCSGIVYVHSNSGSCASALYKCVPTVESRVTALRHYLCVLR